MANSIPSFLILPAFTSDSLKEEADYTKYIQNPMDKSWLKKLSDSLEYATKSFNQYDYAGALDAIESRFWDFCDNYLEIVKSRAYSEDNTSAVASLMKTIDTFILAFAPFVPFIAEEVYQARSWKKGDNSVHQEAWPKVSDFVDLQANNSVLYDSVSVIASEIRKAKTAAGKTQRTPVIKVEIEASEKLRSVLEAGKTDIENVGRLTSTALTFTDGKELKVLDVQLDMDFVPEPKKK